MTKSNHTPLPTDYNFVRINRSSKVRSRNVTLSEGVVGVCNQGTLLDHTINNGEYSYSIILNEKTRDAIAEQSPKYVHRVNNWDKLVEALELLKPELERLKVAGGDRYHGTVECYLLARDLKAIEVALALAKEPQ